MSPEAMHLSAESLLPVAANCIDDETKRTARKGAGLLVASALLAGGLQAEPTAVDDYLDDTAVHTEHVLELPDASELMAAERMSLTTVAVGGLGVYALWQAGLIDKGMDNFTDWLGDLALSNEEFEDSLVGRVERTWVNDVDVTIPMTVSSILELKVEVGEGQLFYFFGPEVGIHTLDGCVVGQSDLAVRGTISAERSQTESNIIDVSMAAPEPWGTRLLAQTLDLDCHGDSGIRNLWGTPETRDQATTDMLVMMTLMMEAESCRVAREFVIGEQQIEPLIVDMFEAGSIFGNLGYRSGVDRLRVSYTFDTSEENRYVSLEEYRDFYENYDTVEDFSQRRPLLSQAGLLEELQRLSEIYDVIEFKTGDGQTVSVEEVLNRGYLCSTADLDDNVVTTVTHGNGTPEVAPRGIGN